MYTLIFKKNRSKYFQGAIGFALELGASFDGRVCTLEIPRDRLLRAYSTMRQLFAFVQDWKGTKAFYNGFEVHPYRFILYLHQVGECAGNREQDFKGCLTQEKSIGWGCKKVDAVLISANLNVIYNESRKFWFNYGKFDIDGKWIIDKEEIKSVLLNHVNSKGINLCPFFDETEMLDNLRSLPDWIIPDGVLFEREFRDVSTDKGSVMSPVNINYIGHGIFDLRSSLSLE